MMVKTYHPFFGLWKVFSTQHHLAYDNSHLWNKTENLRYTSLWAKGKTSCPWESSGSLCYIYKAFYWYTGGHALLPPYEASGLTWPGKWKNIQGNIVSWIFSVTFMQASLPTLYKQKSWKWVTPFSRISRTILVFEPHFPVIDFHYNFEHSCTKLLVLLPGIGFDSAVYLNLLPAHWLLVHTLHGTGTLIHPAQW